MTEADLERTRGRLQIATRQLFVAPAWLPAGADVLTLERSARVLLAGPEDARRELVGHAAALAARVVHQPDLEAVMAELGRAA